MGLLLGLGTTAAQLATPMVTKTILDGLRAQAPIGPAVSLLVGLLVIATGLGLVQWILLGGLAERIVLDARSSMVRRLLRGQAAALSGRSSGELVTRVTSDTVLLKEAAATSVADLVNGFILLVGALVLMGTLDWMLLGATLGILAISGVAVAALMPPVARAQHDAQAAVGRLGGVLEGTLHAIRTVKASRAEGRQSAKVVAEAQEAARQSIRAVRFESVAWVVAGSGVELAVLLVLALGAWRVSTGELQVSSLVAFLLYLFQIMAPATTLAQTASQLQSGMAASARIHDVQSMEVEPAEPPASAAGSVRGSCNDRMASSNEPVLTFRNVTARHRPDGPPALNEVSVSIPRRGHTAIVGPSGAGKTTMLSLILCFLQPQKGELTLDGQPFTRFMLSEVRSRMVYVEQDAPLLPGTLRENLLCTHPGAAEDALWAALRAVRLEDRARSLTDGLDTVLTAASISGGERQRIALARALVREPEIRLLDEATAQLDGLTEAAINDVVSRVAARGAVVTIAHRLSTVSDADQIVLLDQGRLRALGTHAELLGADELYRDLVATLRLEP